MEYGFPLRTTPSFIAGNLRETEAREYGVVYRTVQVFGEKAAYQMMLSALEQFQKRNVYTKTKDRPRTRGGIFFRMVKIYYQKKKITSDDFYFIMRNKKRGKWKNA